MQLRTLANKYKKQHVVYEMYYVQYFKYAVTSVK
jgi:hypothetical protein